MAETRCIGRDLTIPSQELEDSHRIYESSATSFTSSSKKSEDAVIPIEVSLD